MTAEPPGVTPGRRDRGALSHGVAGGSPGMAAQSVGTAIEKPNVAAVEVRQSKRDAPRSGGEAPHGCQEMVPGSPRSSGRGGNRNLRCGSREACQEGKHESLEAPEGRGERHRSVRDSASATVDSSTAPQVPLRSPDAVQGCLVAGRAGDGPHTATLLEDPLNTAASEAEATPEAEGAERPEDNPEDTEEYVVAITDKDPILAGRVEQVKAWTELDGEDQYPLPLDASALEPTAEALLELQASKPLVADGTEDLYDLPETHSPAPEDLYEVTMMDQEHSLQPFAGTALKVPMRNKELEDLLLYDIITAQQQPPKPHQAPLSPTPATVVTHTPLEPAVLRTPAVVADQPRLIQVHGKFPTRPSAGLPPPKLCIAALQVILDLCATNDDLSLDFQLQTCRQKARKVRTPVKDMLYAVDRMWRRLKDKHGIKRGSGYILRSGDMAKAVSSKVQKELDSLLSATEAVASACAQTAAAAPAPPEPQQRLLDVLQVHNSEPSAFNRGLKRAVEMTASSEPQEPFEEALLAPDELRNRKSTALQPLPAPMDSNPLR
eukprot:CAMPEP_0174306000 /NCGR_PEP_ID=MMETSP0810-20121108/166_1 /TAXON_ID=73025 ORGANISM="Eutreptiella gymnastica-like, Strain CCMP1594" /NCGR_SAMPLE_ID=MMETSP0810 /ASSEMBLY_ACC=CAM_ASM_000659 /LENGTH=548 /DNA_ID=CAMNT_0015412583 /DNA_START=111 /DNA_END=1757 /DNA_ORIENTATION=-